MLTELCCVKRVLVPLGPMINFHHHISHEIIKLQPNSWQFFATSVAVINRSPIYELH